MEQTWINTLPIIKRFQSSQTAGTSSNATIDIENKVVRQLCGANNHEQSRFHSKHKLHYTEEIQDTCTQLIDKNAKVISQELKGTFPSLSNLYQRTKDLCVTKLDLCDVPNENMFESNKHSKCDLCKMVVDDFTDTYTRSKGSTMYLSKTHVWGHFDDACTMIQARYPKSISSRMIDMCENLLDEYEEDIADVFLKRQKNPAKQICGKKGMNVCKNQQGQWGVDKPLKSPFSFRPSLNYEL
tara:strand:- start:88 stop:810 length:723 start_codon:yes stop_codon:yes gene_type:complete